MAVFIENYMKPSFASAHSVTVVNTRWRVAGAAAALLRALGVD